MGLVLFMLTIYAVPFGALFALRRARWLAVGGAAAAAVVALIYGFAMTVHGESGLIFFLILYALALGSLSGAAARIVLIALGRNGRRASELVIGALFLVGVPALISASSQLRQREFRKRYAPPTAECRASLHDVILGDAIARLPIDEGIHVGEGRGFKPVTMFDIQEQARVFCERTDRSPFRATNINIEFARRGSAPPHHRPPCDRPRAGAWWPMLCRFAQDPRVHLYSMILFDPARYNSDQMLSFSPMAPGAPAGPFDAKWHSDGPFKRMERDGYIYLRRAAVPGTASAYAGICSRPAHPEDSADGLRCKAGYRLTRQVALMYDFQVAEDDLIAQAQALDARLLPVARSLLVASPR